MEGGGRRVDSRLLVLLFFCQFGWFWATMDDGGGGVLQRCGGEVGGHTE